MTENEQVKEIIKKINEAGGRVLLVGGYVRDHLLHRENKDVDIEIHDISVAKVKSILEKYGQLDQVGSQFGILKIRGLDIDFAFPRLESNKGDRHTDLAVTVNPFLSIRESARRRDLTMNAIMQDTRTGEILDPFNGQTDIKAGIIKFVDETTFADDVLRPLRACQFAARFNMTIDPALIKLSQHLDYTKLSTERIVEEIKKALQADKPSIAFNYMKKMGILKQIAPELDALETVPQDPIHHSEGNVWIHTMQVLDMAKQVSKESHDPYAFIMFALFHDIGKLKTTVVDQDGHSISSKNHEHVGAEMIQQSASRLVNDKDVLHYMRDMTDQHMRIHNVLKMHAYKVRKMMLTVDAKDLLLFNICDDTKSGHSTLKLAKNATEYNKKKERLLELSQGKEYQIIPKIKGRDLMSWGLKPSPLFTKILDEALDLQIQSLDEKQIKKILTHKYLVQEQTNEAEPDQTSFEH